MFVDIVSKNGNLLINVGPQADGTIPDNQLKPLKDLGKWLKLNGEGIYDSDPWKKPSRCWTTKQRLGLPGKMVCFMFIS
jgi:alpha-L-fucosidase